MRDIRGKIQFDSIGSGHSHFHSSFLFQRIFFSRKEEDFGKNFFFKIKIQTYKLKLNLNIKVGFKTFNLCDDGRKNALQGSVRGYVCFGF